MQHQQLNTFFCLGCECTGIVTRVGSEVNDLKVEARVAALAPFGCYRSYLRVDSRFAAPTPIPDSMPFNTAAAMVVNHPYRLVNYSCSQESVNDKV